MKPSHRWGLVVLFALAMAWFEASTVYYLRVLVDRVQPYQANPMPLMGSLEHIELVREAATLVMLLAIGAIAGRTHQARLGYTAIAFGVWDIFYYVFLRLISGWPQSLFDWDLLFLLPLPWWGPVLAPMCIAALMIIWGTIVSDSDRGPHVPLSSRLVWALTWLGVALAMGVFMADSLRVIPQGLGATRTVLPQHFNWPVFGVALALMAAPVARAASAFVQRVRE